MTSTPLHKQNLPSHTCSFPHKTMVVTNFHPPTTTKTTTTTTSTQTTTNNSDKYYDNDDYINDSNCSTPYVSSPSSPRHRTTTTPSEFFFYSAPTSPVHYVARSTVPPPVYDASFSGSFEFEFSSRFDSPAAPEIGPAMSSADELFLNGQIRPMKLCAHLNRPQRLPPFGTKIDDIIEDNEDEDECNENDAVFERSRDLKFRDRSQRRRTRSMSPLRSSTPFDWLLTTDEISTPAQKALETTESSEKEELKDIPSASSSRCSSAGRSSKRWVFLKDFLRSKSEGTGRSNNKFWQNINMSFSAAKEKEKEKEKRPVAKKAVAGKRRSAHEMHYAANRAQAEEMRKKTFLPYRQGLLGGCLGFNSKSYTAFNGFVRGLNPVSSR